jgi:hypothetical protein
MFHGLFGVFVPRLVIFLAMMHRGHAMSMSGKFVELRSSLVRIICHTVLRSAHTTLALWSAHVHAGHAEDRKSRYVARLSFSREYETENPTTRRGCFIRVHARLAETDGKTPASTLAIATAKACELGLNLTSVARASMLRRIRGNA